MTRVRDEKRRNNRREFALYSAMSEVSEISYCAGWNGGNEFAVWRLINGGGKYGMVTWAGDERELELVRAAMDRAGCWIAWAGDEDWRNSGPVAVPIEEWRARVAAREGEKSEAAS